MPEGYLLSGELLGAISFNYTVYVPWGKLLKKTNLKSQFLTSYHYMLLDFIRVA